MSLAVGVTWAQELPAPGSVTAVTEQAPKAGEPVAPIDDEGTALILRWQAPKAAPPEGLAVAGYVVYQRQESQPLAEAEVGALVEGADKTEAKVGRLSPWPSEPYYLWVTAVYLPVGVVWQVNEEATQVVSPGKREAASAETGPVQPVGRWYNHRRTNVAITALLYTVIVILALIFARRRDMYVRPISGLQAVDDAIGRATEMGRPLLFVSGLTGIGDVATIAAMLILGHLARRTAAYETPILAPCNDPMVMAITREIVRESYTEAGRPDAYQPENIHFVTDSQFGYVAAVDGIMMRERPAACFYMGYFYAESLILAETGNEAGAIQIAGTDADTQLPFFITACDYTLMGEELYAAGAYLSREPVLLAQLKGQDIGKALISAALVVATFAASVVVFLATPKEGFGAVLTQFVKWFDTR